MGDRMNMQLMMARARMNHRDDTWAKVMSLLHFEGADGSTTFTDQKGRTWTAHGGAKILNPGGMTGSGAGTFSGGSDCIQTPASSGLNLYTGAATIEVSFKTTSSGTNVLIMCGADSGTEVPTSISYAIYFASGVLYFRLYTPSEPSYIVASVSGLNDGVRHDVAMDFDTATTNAHAFVDGVDVTTVALGTYLGLNNAATWPTTIGASGVTWGNKFVGVIDEVRIIKGKSLYSSAYTPSFPFPDS